MSQKELQCEKCKKIAPAENVKRGLCYSCWMEETYNWRPGAPLRKLPPGAKPPARKEDPEGRKCMSCSEKFPLRNFKKCGGCGEYYCSSCLADGCSVCQSPLCKDCRHASQASGATICEKHARRCYSCFKTVGTNEIQGCKSCRNHYCEECAPADCAVCRSRVCKSCRRFSSSGKTLCEEHITRCHACEKSVSTREMAVCSSCRLYFCEECGPYRCAICEKRLCTQCRKQSEISGVSLCEEHRIRCQGCRREVSRWETKQCRRCGNFHCLECECDSCRYYS